jgi:hypothetical protein
MSAPRVLVLGAGVCGHLAKGGVDTFSMPVKKGDCLEIDFHAKTSHHHVVGGGLNVNATGDDVSQLRATAAGTLFVAVSASVADDYTLIVR